MFLHPQRSLMFAYMSIFQLYTYTQRRRGESMGTTHLFPLEGSDAFILKQRRDVIHSRCSHMNPFDHALMLSTVSGAMVQ